jgi:phosphotransferase system enzyme I (PtsI)
LDIPCVVGLGNASAETQTGLPAALDGTSGRFITNPGGETISAFQRKEEERRQRLCVLMKTSAEPACTLDGVSILVCANIGSPEEARIAAAQGADGVGLFRTEFLYMDSKSLPSEEDQFTAYRQALDALGTKPLTIRTLDIGGDKDHPALGLEKEGNPFLGYRAIRLSLDRPSILKPQLRAVLRSAVFGRVELMFPLVVTLDEFKAARSLVEEYAAELASEGIEAVRPPLGIMVETPAAVLMAVEFAAAADFFSIGTNDLTQYTLAADRGNPRVARLYDPLNPAVLRLLAAACNAAMTAGIPVSLCGELAADQQALPLLIGLGITKLSLSAPGIPSAKAQIRTLDKGKCIRLARQALTLPSAAEVHALLSAFAAS